MAVAKVICTCDTCGKEFEYRRKGLANRAAADSFEEWAKDHINECPDCRAKRKLEEAKAQAVEDAKLVENYDITLPELKGSEKQIKWATDIRAKFLAETIKDKIYDVKKVQSYAMKNIPDDFKKQLNDQGMTVDEYLEAMKKKSYIKKIMIMTTESSASEIIDNRF